MYLSLPLLEQRILQRRRVTVMALLLVAGVSPVWVAAQEGLHPRYRQYDDRVPRDQDYFTAHRDRMISDLLRVVEAHHLGSTFWARYRAGRFEEVIPDLRYMLDKFPNHPKALALLGTVAKLTKRPSLALSYFRRALLLYPQHALTRAQLGIYLVDSDQLDQGLRELTEAVEMDPNLPAAHAWLAATYYKMGKPGLAREAASKARRLGFSGGIPYEPQSGGPRQR